MATADGVPCLATEVQLLLKFKGLRDKDDLDARQVLPELGCARQQWLRDRLPADHPWHDYLS